MHLRLASSPDRGICVGIALVLVGWLHGPTTPVPRPDQMNPLGTRMGMLSDNERVLLLA
jgi:hypothetical protein